MTIACHGESRTRVGRRIEEETLLVVSEGTPLIALADSSEADRPARKVLSLFRRLFAEAHPEEVRRFSTWAHWMGILDLALVGGTEAAFAAVAAVGHRIIGASVGSCRAYLFDGNGNAQSLTGDGQRSPRNVPLGTGGARVSPIHCDLRPQDLLLLLSEGAWTPLSLSHLRRAIAGASHGHVSAVPRAVLDAAGARAGHSRNMTAVALQRIE